MTVQSVDTLYPFHNHAISEMYYNMRLPACTNQFKSLAIKADSPLLETVKENDKMRRVRFDAGQPNVDAMWLSGSSERDPLLYFHQNTIHAFDVDAAAKPSRKRER